MEDTEWLVPFIVLKWPRFSVLMILLCMLRSRMAVR